MTLQRNMVRFRSGYVSLVKANVKKETIIFAGDLVALVDGFLLPYNEHSVNFTQGLSFAASFLGIAHQPSDLGIDDTISVDTSPFSVYEMDCTPTKWQIGDLIQPYSNQTLALGEDRFAAIGRTVEFTNSLSTRIKVQFASAFHPASANIHAKIG